MGKPEGIIEDYLGKLCRDNGFLYYKFTSPANAGVPDRIIIAKGQVVFAELKKPTGHEQTIQKAVFSKMRGQGAKVYVVHNKLEARKLVVKLGGKIGKKEKSIFRAGRKLGQFRVEKA